MICINIKEYKYDSCEEWQKAHGSTAYYIFQTGLTGSTGYVLSFNPYPVQNDGGGAMTAELDQIAATGALPPVVGSPMEFWKLVKRKSLKLTCPPVEEQRAISLYLDDRTRKIDSLIKKKQKMIKLLKEERAAVINQAVTKGLEPGAPMRDSGVEWPGEVPEKWDVKRLKHVAEINKSALSENTDSDYRFQYVDIGNVTIEGMTDSPQLMKFKDAPSRARRIVRKGDTIISTVRTYLKAIAYIENNADNLIASTGFAVLTTKILDSKFLYYLMIDEKIIDTINSLSTGVSCPAINSSELANILIWEKELLLLQEYRTALISEVVTGKIDVRGE